MSSKYGFSSPEEKRRKAEQEARERGSKEQNFVPRHVTGSNFVFRRATEGDLADAKIKDVLDDYARVNDCEVDWSHYNWYVGLGVTHRFVVHYEFGNITIRYPYASEATKADVELVARVLREQTGKRVNFEDIPPERGGKES
jgi:hypothetical protein